MNPFVFKKIIVFALSTLIAFFAVRCLLLFVTGRFVLSLLPGSFSTMPSRGEMYTLGTFFILLMSGLVWLIFRLVNLAFRKWLSHKK
jgi:hypothetical protein